ncbi:MAG: hypothetical protein WAT79_12645 [Saprospiraceae bacterium]
MFRIFLHVIICGFLVIPASLLAQQQKSMATSGNKVFIIGEEEKKYEGLINQYSLMLFQACNNSMEGAYEHWNTLLRDMEIHAQKSGFDLKGIKIWINVFWDTDGSIDYIVFHPKPNSKNMNYHELTQFFNSFIGFSELPLKTTRKYSHYGSASFPLFNKSNLAQEK